MIDFKDLEKKLNNMYNEIFEEQGRYIDVIDNNDRRGNLKLLAGYIIEKMEKVNEAIDNVVYELDDLCDYVEQFDIEKERIESKYE